MNKQNDSLGRLERELRTGLSGLPRPDVDDFIEEMLSHIAEESAEGRSIDEAVEAFGDPAAVAREFVERRLAGGESEVRPAGVPRRVMAWVADFVIGWGPLVICPIWLVALMWFIDRFLMSAEQIAQLTSEFGYQRASVHPLLLLLTAGLVVWGVYYWRVLRARSASIGMRMAGISRLEAGGERVVVHTVDLASSEPARIVARAKWYVGVPVSILAVIVAGAFLYYLTFAIGSLAQPWDFVAEATSSAEDLRRADPVIEEFYAQVIAGDVDAARSLATTRSAQDVEALVARAKADGVNRIERGENVGENQYLVHEYREGEPGSRTVALTVERFDEQTGPSTWSAVYRVSDVDMEWVEPGQ